MVTEYFDKAAASWDEHPVRRLMQQTVYAAMREAVPFDTSMDVLEYGCGTAAFSLALAPEVRSVIAADVSRGMLDVAEEKARACGAEHVRMVEMNLEVTEPEAACVDCVATVMATHHIHDLEKVFSAWARMLRPGGWLALADLFLEDGSFHDADNPVPHHGFDPENLSEMLARAGFHDATWKEIHRVSKPVNGVERVFPLFLLTARI